MNQPESTYKSAGQKYFCCFQSRSVAVFPFSMSQKILESHLSKYSAVRQWSDLTLWLQRLATVIQQLTDFNPKLFDQVMLRLGQSLNPELMSPVHQECLKVYLLIARRHISGLEKQESWMDTFCVGVMPFVSKGSVKVRGLIFQLYEMLAAYRKVIVRISKGLVTSLFASLNSNKSLETNVKELIFKIQTNTSTRHLLEDVWSVLLRSPDGRIPALKFLMHKIPAPCLIKSTDSSDDSEDIEQNLATSRVSIDIVNYFPSFDTLVIKSLLACLEDDSQVVKKAVLQLMIVFLKPDDQKLNQFSLQLLLDRVLRMLARKDMALFRKMYHWLFGRPDEDYRYQRGQSLELICQWLKKQLKVSSSKTLCLKIILNLLSDHDNFVQPVMKSLGHDLLAQAYQLGEAEQTKLLGRILGLIPDKKLLIRGMATDKQSLQYVLSYLTHLADAKQKSQHLSQFVAAVIQREDLQIQTKLNLLLSALQACLQISDQTLQNQLFKFLSHIPHSQKRLRLLALLQTKRLTPPLQRLFLQGLEECLKSEQMKRASAEQIGTLWWKGQVQDFSLSDQSLELCFQILWKHQKVPQRNKLLLGLSCKGKRLCNNFFSRLIAAAAHEDCLNFLELSRSLHQSHELCKSELQKLFCHLIIQLLEGKSYCNSQVVRTWLRCGQHLGWLFSVSLNTISSILQAKQAQARISQLELHFDNSRLLFDLALLNKAHSSLSRLNSYRGQRLLLLFFELSLRGFQTVKDIGVRGKCLRNLLQVMKHCGKEGVDMMQRLKVVFQSSLQKSLQLNDQQSVLRILTFFNSAFFQTPLLSFKKDLVSPLVSDLINQSFIELLRRALTMQKVVVILAANRCVGECLSLIESYMSTQRKQKLLNLVLVNYRKTIGKLVQQKREKALELVLSGLIFVFKFYRHDDCSQFVNANSQFSTKFQLTEIFLFDSQWQSLFKAKKDYSKSKEILLSHLDSLLSLAISCWQLSGVFQQYSSRIELSGEGMNTFEFDEFNRFNKEMNRQWNQCRGVNKALLLLINLVSDLFESQFFQKIYIMWARLVSAKSSRSMMLKMLQLISLFMITYRPLPHFMKQLLKYNDSIFKLGRRQKKDPKFSLKGIDNQTNFIFLITGICHLAPLTVQFYKNLDNLRSTWQEATSILAAFSQSKFPNVHLWVFDFLHLLVKKINPKQIQSSQRKHISKLINPAIADLLLLVEGYQFQKMDREQSVMAESKFFPESPTLRTKKQKFIFKSQLAPLFLSKNAYIILRQVCIPLAHTFLSQHQSSHLYKLLMGKVLQQGFQLEHALEIGSDLVEIDPLVAVHHRKDFFKLFERYSSKCNAQQIKLWQIFLKRLQNIESVQQNLLSNFINKILASRQIFSMEKKKNGALVRACVLLFCYRMEMLDERLVQRTVQMLVKSIQSLELEDDSGLSLDLILLLVRIMILKLEGEKRSNFFLLVWPLVYPLLKKVLLTFSEKRSARQAKWLVSALKLVELLMMSGIQEMQTVRWCFICDRVNFCLKDISKASKNELSERRGILQLLLSHKFQLAARDSSEELCASLMTTNKRGIGILTTEYSWEMMQAKVYSLCEQLSVLNQYGGDFEVNQVMQDIQNELITLSD